MPELSTSLVPRGLEGDAPGVVTFGALRIRDTARVRLYSAKLAKPGNTHATPGAPAAPSAAGGSMSPALPLQPDRKAKVTTRVVKLPDEAEAAKLVQAVQTRFSELLTSPAVPSGPAGGAAPPARRLLAVLSPHSGKRRAVHTFKSRIAPLLQAAGIEAHVVTTKRARHAVDLGAAFLLAQPAVGGAAPAAAAAAATAAGEALSCCPDGVLFVSGDGTVQEFVNGMLAGADAALAEAESAAAAAPAIAAALSSVPLCLVPAGTQNALARGMKTLSPEAGALAVIFRARRSFDALRVSNAAARETLSLCGLGWGIPSAIARDSEAWRRWGTARYALLKIVHGLRTGLGLQKFPAVIHVAGDGGLAPSPTSPLLQHVVAGKAGEAAAPVAKVAEHIFTFSSPASTQDASSVSTSGTGLASAASGGAGAEVAEEGPASADKGAMTPPTTPADVIVVAAPAAPSAVDAGGSTTLLQALPLQPLMECKTDCETCSSRTLLPGFSNSGSSSVAAAAGSTAQDAGAAAHLPHTHRYHRAADHDTDAPNWRYEESGAFIALGAINISPDARFCHGSDGRLDVVVARRGGLLRSFALMARYVGRTLGIRSLDERASPLFDYVKAGSMVIAPSSSASTKPKEQDGRRSAASSRPSPADGVNVDGEFFLGPGPFTVSVLPGMLTVYGFA